MAADDREYDLCVLGATGYTGRLIVDYLLFNSIGSISFLGSSSAGATTTTATRKIKLCIAARDHLKILTMLSKVRLRAESMPTSPLTGLFAMVEDDIGMLTVDVSNEDSVKEMVTRSRCVLSCCGPYKDIGEPLVKACVDHGTDYVDLTGEAGWMLEMIAKYQDKAKANKVLLVPASGMDCVPSDVVAWAAYELLSKSTRIKSHVRFLSCADLMSTKNDSVFDLMFSMPMSSGTFRTLLNAIRDGEFNKRHDKYTDKAIIGNLGVHHEYGYWLIPNEVLPDGMIIRRTMQLLLGSDEPFAPTSFEAHYFFVSWNRLTSMVTDVFLRAFMPLLRWIPGCLSLMNWAIGNNQGPSETFRSKSLIKVIGIAESYDEKLTKLAHPMAKAEVILTSTLNPYELTAIVVSEISKLIATQKDTLPGATRMGYGFLTPVTCCGGEILIKNCANAFTLTSKTS